MGIQDVLPSKNSNIIYVTTTQPNGQEVRKIKGMEQPPDNVVSVSAYSALTSEI